MRWPECCVKTQRKAQNLQQILSTHSSVSHHSLISTASSRITRLVRCVCRSWIMKSRDTTLGKRNSRVRTRLISFYVVTACMQRFAKDATMIFTVHQMVVNSKNETTSNFINTRLLHIILTLCSPPSGAQWCLLVKPMYHWEVYALGWLCMVITIVYLIP